METQTQVETQTQIRRVYRQGDVMLVEMPWYTKEDVEKGAVEKRDAMVIASENGNKHVLNARTYVGIGAMYVVVEKPTPMTHPQHPMLIIEPGIYRVEFVRDYALEEERPVD